MTIHPLRKRASSLLASIEKRKDELLASPNRLSRFRDSNPLMKSAITRDRLTLRFRSVFDSLLIPSEVVGSLSPEDVQKALLWRCANILVAASLHGFDLGEEMILEECLKEGAAKELAATRVQLNVEDAIALSEIQ